jgi:tRNA pseudouridine38-40 synthase
VRTYLLHLSYDGTDFHGFQRQANARSVQGELEKALDSVLSGDFKVGSSSRTDAGVHALRHPVSVTTGRMIPLHGLVKGLNSLLPRDVAVVEAREVPPGLHPRKSSTHKTYYYRVFEGGQRDPLLTRTSWWVKRPLDLEAMRQAAAFLVGEHDFAAFRSAECDSKSTQRFLSLLRIEREAALVTITVSGNAFLRNMVRIVAGCLVEVGLGKHPPAWVGEVLASKDRTRGGITAPAHGLFLADVHFPTELLADGAHGF